MANYDEKEFFPIFLSAIRVDTVLPFHSYLLLKANGRIVRLVKTGEPFTEEKFNKLKEFDIGQLYIHIKDEAAYAQYLRSFFKTEEGQGVIEALQKNVLSFDTRGLPKEIASEIGVELPSGELEAVQLLEVRKKELHKKLEYQRLLSDEHRFVINGTTQRIAKQLARVKAFNGTVDESRVLIKDVIDHCDEEILRISGLVGQVGDDCAKIIWDIVDHIKKEVGKIEKTPDFANSEEDLKLKINQASDRVLSEVQRVSNWVEPTENDIVKSTVTGLIEDVEAAFGVNLKEWIQERPQSGKEYDRLTTIAKRQHERLKELDTKLRSSVDSAETLKTMWLELYDMIRPKLSEAEAKKADEFTVLINEIQGVIFDSRQESALLIDGHSELEEEARKVEVVAAPPKPLSQIETTEEARKEAVRVLEAQLEDAKSLIRAYKEKFDELVGVLDRSGRYAEALDREIFQKHNANTNLEESVDRLEVEHLKQENNLNNANRKHRVDQTEIQQRDDKIRDLKTQVLILEEELGLVRQNFKDLNVKGDLMDTDPDKLPFPQPAIALVKEKNEMIADLNSKVEFRETELQGLRKDNLKLKMRVEDFNELKKEMGVRMERVDREKNELKQRRLAMDRKISVLTNLHDQDRKSIEKLTAMTETLKKERVDYMTKTTEAVKNYKDALQKAHSLKGRAEVEAQKVGALTKQMDLLKVKNRELNNKSGEQQGQIRALEAEIRALKHKLKTRTAA